MSIVSTLFDRVLTIIIVSVFLLKIKDIIVNKLLWLKDTGELLKKQMLYGGDLVFCGGCHRSKNMVTYELTGL